MPILALTLLAQSSAQKNSGGAASFLPLILIGVVFYMLILRPQQRRAKEHRALLSQVKQGDRVVAAGGIVGTVRRVDDDTISLQVADNLVLKVDRATVSKRIES